jgi:catechol 2,3-dioxygenase-like lactoylglutathione lyase family enzyme
MSEANVTRVGSVGVPVEDQERALAFYTGVLGFEVRRDVPFGDTRWIEVAPPGAQTSVALVPAGLPGGVRLFTPDAGAAHARLRDQGADVDPEVTRTPYAPPMFVVRDPDGTPLIIVETGEA